jgi:hypothetical protein
MILVGLSVYQIYESTGRTTAICMGLDCMSEIGMLFIACVHRQSAFHEWKNRSWNATEEDRSTTPLQYDGGWIKVSSNQHQL